MVDATLFCSKSPELPDGGPELSPGEGRVQSPASTSATSSDAGDTEVASGVDSLPIRLAPGLPNTPIEACQELMLAIAVMGMADDDLRYVMSPTFLHHLMYVGLDPDTALNVKVAFLRGQVDLKSLRARLSHLVKTAGPWL